MAEWHGRAFHQEKLSKKKKKKRANEARYNYICFSFLFFPFLYPTFLGYLFVLKSKKKKLYVKKWEKKERKKFLYQSWLEKKEKRKKKRSPVYKKLKRNTYTTWKIQIWAYSISAIMPSLPSLPTPKKILNYDVGWVKKIHKKYNLVSGPKPSRIILGLKRLWQMAEWWSKGTVTTFVVFFSSSFLHPEGLFFSTIFCHVCHSAICQFSLFCNYYYFEAREFSIKQIIIFFCSATLIQGFFLSVEEIRWQKRKESLWHLPSAIYHLPSAICLLSFSLSKLKEITVSIIISKKKRKERKRKDLQESSSKFFCHLCHLCYLYHLCAIHKKTKN